ncbi:MAG TPA: Ig-like domain-containing protein [Edaphobacter sp.]|nr:Ig-like domain-containing protein [Edaphobacter sp.]
MPEGAVVADPVDERCERFLAGAVVGLAPIAAMAHQAGAFECGEVLGDHGLRDSGARGQGVNGEVAVAGEPFEERSSGGIGESFEDAVCGVGHGKTITTWLLVVKRKFYETRTFLGASNNGTVNPLVVTLDKVTSDTLASSKLIAPSNAQVTLGPGQVSSTLTSLLLPNNGSNGNVITDARTAPALMPPDCSFTFLAPELTGPNGTNQTVSAGQFPTAVVILTSTFASNSYPYPTGTVMLTDDSGRTFTATLSGLTDTAFVPIANAPARTHTSTASYSGDTTYAAISSFGSSAFADTLNLSLSNPVQRQLPVLPCRLLRRRRPPPRTERLCISTASASRSIIRQV